MAVNERASISRLQIYVYHLYIECDCRDLDWTDGPNGWQTIGTHDEWLTGANSG